MMISNHDDGDVDGDNGALIEDGLVVVRWLQLRLVTRQKTAASAWKAPAAGGSSAAREMFFQTCGMRNGGPSNSEQLSNGHLQVQDSLTTHSNHLQYLQYICWFDRKPNPSVSSVVCR